jgi:hypothetical protein
MAFILIGGLCSCLALDRWRLGCLRSFYAFSVATGVCGALLLWNAFLMHEVPIFWALLSGSLAGTVGALCFLEGRVRLSSATEAGAPGTS